ncbi:acetate--CoA ligase family protein [Dactylosporangium sp. CA-092794]|uniref:acetate--CoA ligase family protein n=1 Tax=Dactylosporangium sp. CA-092794 TaxID=3239929 RepID=UPI003D8B56A2
MTDGKLHSLLEPEGIVVYGVSTRAATPGHRIMRYLQEYGFSKRVVGVSRTAEEVAGFPCVPGLEDLEGDAPEHAVVVVPQNVVAEALRDCGRRGVKTVSVLAAGYSELGNSGRQMEVELTDIAAEYGMRVLGPNCLGVVNAHTGMVASAGTAFEVTRVILGPVSIISQSGLVGTYIASRLLDQKIGIRYLISTGNEADIDLGEALGAVGRDSHTDTIVIYAEGLRNGPRFVDGLRTARQLGKQVIVLKVGRTEVGAAAVRSHTSALAGDDAVFDHMLERLGAMRAHSITEVTEAVSLACDRSAARTSGTDRIGILTISGGLGAIGSELLVDRGFSVPPMPHAVQQAMRGLLPYCTPTNPIDATGQIVSEPEKFAEFLAMTADSGSVDVLFVLLAYAGVGPSFPVLRLGIEQIARSGPLRVVLVGQFGARDRQELRGAGVLVVDEIEDGVRWLEVLRKLRRAESRANGVVELVLPRGRATAGQPIDEARAMTLLAECGVPVARFAVVDAARDAPGAADRLGFPVVLKRLEPGVVHKSDLGLVRVRLEDQDSVAAAADELEQRGSSEGRFLVQEMVPGPRNELIVSAWYDDVFGLSFLLGFGGVLVELLHDRTIMLPPLSADVIRDAVGRLRGAQLFSGYRDRPAIDTSQVLRVLEKLHEFLMKNDDIVEVELNPVLFGTADDSPVAVDAVLRSRLDRP